MNGNYPWNPCIFVQSNYGRINDGSHRRTQHALQIVNEDIPDHPSAPPIIVWFRDDLRLSDHPPSAPPPKPARR
jgi:hypothetical protein